MTERKAFSVIGVALVVAGLLWLKVSTASAAPPQNDAVGSAAVISTLLFRDFLNVSEATSASDDPDCFGQGATVWYVFTPAEDMDLTANTFGSNYDTTLSVYTGSPGALSQIACNNDAGVGFQSQVRFTAIGSQTYYFMVGSPFLPGGSPSLVFTVDVAVPPPANDDFNGAVEIASLPFTDSNRDTRGATTADDDPSCFGQAATVWYSFSPSENMRVDVSTLGSSYSPAISVYTGSRGSLNQIACNQFSASFPVISGRTYYIMVSALPGPYPFDPLGGSLTLNVSGTPSTPNDDFDSATVIPALPFTETLDTRGATRASDDPSPSCGVGLGSSVWYAFTPAQNVRVGISAFESNYPTLISVYTGARGSLTQVTCGFASASYDAIAGTPYFIMVDSSGFSTGGTLRISALELTPAPNDDFDNATAITDLPFTDNLGGLGATAASDDPACWPASLETVWYTFTPAQNIRLEATASGSTFPEIVSVFTGSRGLLTSVVCNPNQVTFDAVADTQYFIMVGSQFAASGATVFSLRELTAPPNDDFDNATEITSLPFTDNLNTSLATRAPDDPPFPFPFLCAGDQDATVWYSFSPSQPMRVEANTLGSNYSTTLYVLTGTRGALDQIACAIFSSPASFTATPGTIYYIMVAGPPSGGNLRFNMQLIPPPANDDFDNAVPITALPFSDFRDTRGATVAGDDPDPSCGGRDATVWYSFTPTEDMRLEADTFGTSYYGAVSVFTGSRNNLTEVACSNPGPVLTPLRFDALASETYYIMVGAGPGLPPGSLSFHLTAIPPAPPNDDIGSATLITDADLPFNASLDTRGASTAPDDPTPFCSGTRTATVWFSFTPGETMRIDADTFGSNYSANISVYTGAPGALSEFLCGFSQISFTANAGQRYFFFVASSGTSGGNLNFNVRRIPPPANDDFDSAVVITSLPFTDNRDTRAATTASDDPSTTCGALGTNVWYAFTPTQNMRIEANTSGSNYSPSLSVYTGVRGALTQVVCSPPFSPVRLRIDLTANTTYFIMVSADLGAGGDLVLSIEALVIPSNDNFDNATPIPSLPFTDSLNTRGAGAAADDPFCNGQGPTVWYSFTPTETVRIEANTFGSDYNTTLSIYTGTRGSLNQVACNDDAGGSIQSQVRFEATPGQTYFFMISARTLAFPLPGGNLAFSVNVGPPGPPNDIFDNTTAIGVLPFDETLNTAEATTAADDPFPSCGGGRNATVWYAFTPEQDMRLEANTIGSSYNTNLAVYTGARGALTEIACNEDAPDPFGLTLTSRVRFDVVGGQTYFFMIGASLGGLFPGTGAGGNLVFSIRELNPPPNDDFANATNVGQLLFTDSLNTRDADVSPDDPFPSCGGRAATVWYAFTPAEPVRIEANTSGSNYDTTLSVYTGSRGALTQVVCNDNSGFGSQSQVRLELFPNQTYYFMVGAQSFPFGQPGGDLVFNVNFAPPGPANDIFENATPITLPSFTDSVDTREATVAPDDPFPFCSGARDATVWYAITPAADTLLEINTSGSSYSVFLSVHTGSRGALDQTMCSFGQLSFNAAAGTTYFLLASSSFGGGGDLALSVQAIAPPANDDIADAVPITTFPFTDSNRDTRAATTHPDDPFPSCGGRDATVWYSITPNEDTQFEANTSGSNYSAGLSVYTGSPGALVEVVCDGSLLRFTASAGTTYYLMVGSFQGTGGNLSLTVEALAPPANDQFANAIPITTLPFDDNRDVRGATTHPDDPFPSCGGRSATVWYALTTTEELRIEVNAFSNYTTGLSLFTGGPGAFNEVACNFNQVSFSASPGVTYYLMVGSPFGPSGQLALQVLGFRPPANDNIANAEPISAFPFNTNLDTRGASAAPDDPSPSCGGRDATVWYTFSVDHATQIEFNTFGSNYSTGLSVYSGSPGTLTEVACRESLVRFTATPGTTYFLMVVSFFGAGGDLVLNGLELTPPANDAIGNAIEIASLPFTDSGDTRGATTAPDDPTPSCTGNNGREATVWYTFTAAENLRIDANTFGSDYGANLAVYTGTPGALTEAACGGQEVSFGALAGQTYFIMLGGAPGGNLSLSVQGTPSPANDDFDSTTIITSLPFTDNLNTSGATAASDDPPPSCTSGSGRNATVWYAFTADQVALIGTNSFGSDYPTVLAVYTGTRGALSEIACGGAKVVFTANTGTTYFFMVGSQAAMGGNLALSVVQALAPANFTLNSTADAVDANPGDGTCATGAGECTLRAAIQETNALPTDDTITLTAGTYQLTLAGAGEDAAVTGDFDITDNLTITGAGATSTIVDGNRLDGVFHIIGSTTVTIAGVTVQNGLAIWGSGIFNDGGILTLNNSVVTNNGQEQPSSGGGMFNAGTLTVNNSTVSNNTATTGGGLVNAGVMALNNSTVSGNVVTGTFGTGAGIYNGGSFLSGVGILTLSNSTISGNRAFGTFGASGGGIVSDNFTGNVTVTLRNSIVAGNTASDSIDCRGSISSSGFNLIGNTSGCTFTPTNGDLTNLDPMLGPLQDNGGPTLTHALLPGSPAIDAGNPAAPGSGGTACEATDQRGVTRPQGAACDIGAFEAKVKAPPKLKIKIKIDKTGLLALGRRSATMSGTVTCSQPVRINLSGTLTQRVENRVIRGTFTLAVECSGQTSWSPTVRAERGRFVEGRVRVSMTASAIDPVSGKLVHAQASRNVQLIRPRR